MPTTSKVTVKTVIKGTGIGGSLQGEHTMVNTTGSRVTVETTFGSGVSAATSFRSPANARFLTIVLPSTNTNAWRLTGDTAEVGVALSSHGVNVYSLPESTVGTLFFAYTTGSRDISGVRLTYS